MKRKLMLLLACLFVGIGLVTAQTQKVKMCIRDRSHIAQLVFGQISGNIGIFNTRCKQAADNEYCLLYTSRCV